MKTMLLILLLMCPLALAKKNILLTSVNTVVLDTNINISQIRDLKKELLNLVLERGKKNYPLYLVIESPGGSIDAGENFIRYAKSVKNLHTVTIFAASMAHAIVQALPGKRYVVEGGTFMAHRARLSMSGQINEGEFESRLRLIKKQVSNMEKRNSKRIGISLEKYRKKVKDEWWTYGDENIEQNVADEIVSVECSKYLQTLKREVKMHTPFGVFKFTESKCPLL